MMKRMRRFLFSLQTKLVLTITSVMLLAIFLAGVVFVVRERDDRRQQALDRVAAASPAIYQRAYVELLSTPGEQDEEGEGEETVAGQLDALAQDQNVRILILNRDGIILHDTAYRLRGVVLPVPASSAGDIQRGFISWEPGNEFPENNLTMISASARIVARGRPVPFRVVLATETATIADAWRSVLPGLLLAALVAVPLSALAGILLARQVAHPVGRLTAASEAMARGDFDQRVEVDRDDEIGRLARSFTTMAARVGQRDAQMRALLANVSHDLKTPMTTITGYGQSLADGIASPEDAPRVGAIIRDEAEHVNRMLGDLLYLGEIDAGQIIRQREDAPLAALVARCARRIETLVAERRIGLTIDVGPDVILRNVDTEKIERALTNVFDNAAKFTPAGGSIAVRGWADTAIHCSVTNTGAAIPEEDLARVFDRFYRGDRSRGTAGSGLGLSIARELVELHGGHISAANTEDGVRLTVSLPPA